MKLVKGGLFVMHAVRYLGALTRCNFKIFETCTKRAARQSGISRMAVPRSRTHRFAYVSLYKYLAGHSRMHRAVLKHLSKSALTSRESP
ncbi:MAG TPA: hypothetical protein VN065_07665 [Bradyrhizobium sp.]|nr:hypothetical protein [Bradyrhizobium sp.]